MLAVAPHVKSGRPRSLDVTSVRRSTLLPDVPTIAEAGVPGYEVASWNGLMAPAGVAFAIIAKMHKDATIALQFAEVRDKLAAGGAEAVSSTPAEFTRFIRGELEKWGGD